MVLTVRELAYRRSQIREDLSEGTSGNPDDDWAEATSLLHQLVEEAAYHRWVDRGRPDGDSRADWLAAEGEIHDGRQDGHRPWTPGEVDRRLRRQLVREKAYFHWLGRGTPWGDPLTDWLAAEEEVPSQR